MNIDWGVVWGAVGALAGIVALVLPFFVMQRQRGERNDQQRVPTPNSQIHPQIASIGVLLAFVAVVLFGTTLMMRISPNATWSSTLNLLASMTVGTALILGMFVVAHKLMSDQD